MDEQKIPLADIHEPPPAPVEGSVFTHSASIAKLALALAQAQLQYGDLKASQVADAEKYSYRYADLAAVLAAVRPALAGQAIAVMQGVSMQRSASGSGLVVLVETRLVHQSGEWIATTLKLPSGEVAPQKVGSLVTYLRRYGLLALSGVASEDDDAAEAMPRSHKAQSRPEPREQPQTARPAQPLPPTELPPARPKRTTKPKPEPAAVETAMAGTVDRSSIRPVPPKQPVGAPGMGISAAERGLLFKVAREQQVSEVQVKQLLFALFGYTSTSQLRAPEYHKVINALENPADHGVIFDDEDEVIYQREHDANALPQDGL